MWLFEDIPDRLHHFRGQFFNNLNRLHILLHLVNPEGFPGPLFMICSGGLLFGVVFMVTDPVTTPITPRGAWIFGVGTGLLVVLIRLFGGLPEGVMYAILLMNAVTPHITRHTQPRPLGG